MGIRTYLSIAALAILTATAGCRAPKYESIDDKIERLYGKRTPSKPTESTRTDPSRSPSKSPTSPPAPTGPVNPVSPPVKPSESEEKPVALPDAHPFPKKALEDEIAALDLKISQRTNLFDVAMYMFTQPSQRVGSSTKYQTTFKINDDLEYDVSLTTKNAKRLDKDSSLKITQRYSSGSGVLNIQPKVSGFQEDKLRSAKSVQANLARRITLEDWGLDGVRYVAEITTRDKILVEADLGSSTYTPRLKDLGETTDQLVIANHVYATFVNGIASHIKTAKPASAKPKPKATPRQEERPVAKPTDSKPNPFLGKSQPVTEPRESKSAPFSLATLQGYGQDTNEIRQSRQGISLTQHSIRADPNPPQERSRSTVGHTTRLTNNLKYIAAKAIKSGTKRELPTQDIFDLVVPSSIGTLYEVKLLKNKGELLGDSSCLSIREYDLDGNFITRAVFNNSTSVSFNNLTFIDSGLDGVSDLSEVLVGRDFQVNGKRRNPTLAIAKKRYDSATAEIADQIEAGNIVAQKISRVAVRQPAPAPKPLTFDEATKAPTDSFRQELDYVVQRLIDTGETIQTPAMRIYQLNLKTDRAQYAISMVTDTNGEPFGESSVSIKYHHLVGDGLDVTTVTNNLRSLNIGAKMVVLRASDFSFTDGGIDGIKEIFEFNAGYNIQVTVGIGPDAKSVRFYDLPKNEQLFLANQAYGRIVSELAAQMNLLNYTQIK